ncbi:MAG: methyltransferase [Phycisphaera sp.]|nr:methyltransferase [Phycisphaera sp.]
MTQTNPITDRRLAVRLGRPSLFDFRFPDSRSGLDQDEAWCEANIDGKWQRFRFHDYHDIYDVPGLYESLFYRRLRCNSPVRVAGLLKRVLQDAGQTPENLRALDLGAGNGMVGVAMHDIGVPSVVGMDIIPEARDATDRDRPWVYEDYHVVDLTDLSEKSEEQLRSFEANLLVSVAALGFGDVPDQAFLKALDLVETPAWLAFNIHEKFLDDADPTGFAALIRTLQKLGVLRIQALERYRHRLSYKGEPLHYIAIVATKELDVPDELFER